jgi:hypothetical protein
VVESKVLWERWRRADARAREAEVRLRQAWNLFDRYGTIPADELLHEMAQLRQEADQALGELVTGLGARDLSGREPPSSREATRDTDPEAA